MQVCHVINQQGSSSVFGDSGSILVRVFGSTAFWVLNLGPLVSLLVVELVEDPFVPESDEALGVVVSGAQTVEFDALGQDSRRLASSVAFRQRLGREAHLLIEVFAVDDPVPHWSANFCKKSAKKMVLS